MISLCALLVFFSTVLLSIGFTLESAGSLLVAVFAVVVLVGLVDFVVLEEEALLLDERLVDLDAVRLPDLAVDFPAPDFEPDLAGAFDSRFDSGIRWSLCSGAPLRCGEISLWPACWKRIHQHQPCRLHLPNRLRWLQWFQQQMLPLPRWR